MTLRPTTWQHHSLDVRYTQKGIGGIKLVRLGPAQLNAFYAHLLAEGRSHTPGGL